MATRCHCSVTIHSPKRSNISRGDKTNKGIVGKCSVSSGI